MFQLTYSHEVLKPRSKGQITEIAIDGTSVPDTARILKVGINTIIRALKKLPPKQVTSSAVLIPMLLLSASWMDSGVLLATLALVCVQHNNGGYWPILLVHEQMQPVANYWHYSALLA